LFFYFLLFLIAMLRGPADLLCVEQERMCYFFEPFLLTILATNSIFLSDVIVLS